jgi:hypothetical protein
MTQITMYKGGRAMVINVAPGAIEALEKYGWTKEPKIEVLSQPPMISASKDEPKRRRGRPRKK